MTRSIEVIGVPFAHGGATDGPRRGPEALLHLGLLDVLSSLHVPVHLSDVSAMTDDPSVFFSERILRGRIHSEHALINMARLCAARVFAAHRLGRIPVVLGGDHSVSIGSACEYLDPHLSSGRRVGLVWIDAHYDAHTDRTSRSHQAHGMPLASALGRGRRSLGSYRVIDGKRTRLAFDPSLVLHIGAGDMDCEPEEETLLKKLNVETVRMHDIHERGITTFLAPLRSLLARVDDIILSIDLDAIRQDFAPAVSFPSTAGLLPAHLSLIANEFVASDKLRQVEIMEYNPDQEVFTPDGSPLTASLVFVLLSQLLGKK